MRQKARFLSVCAVAAALWLEPACVRAETEFPIDAEIKAEIANIRMDSTVGAEIVCSVPRGTPVEVVSQLYEWYRLRLPKQAPSFVNKSLVAPLDNKQVRVLKDRVNIRLQPSERAAILGKVDKDTVLYVIADRGDWFEIEPVRNSYGWVHKSLVHPFRTGITPAPEPQLPPSAPPQRPAPESRQEPNFPVEMEGIVQPYGKVLNRIATHKLITLVDTDCPDGKAGCVTEKTFLLRGSRRSLNALNYHKVKVSGTIAPDKEQRYPVVDITKVELLD